jgi:hypothetical protein
MIEAIRDLQIDHVIVHSVPRASKRDTNPPEIMMSDGAQTLQGRVREQLELRLRTLLRDAGRRIVEKDAAQSPVPEVVKQLLQSREDQFVPASKQLAVALRDKQSGVNSGGILLVAGCMVNSGQAILLVKIEQEGGLRAEFTTVKGRRMFNMEYLPDLFLTDRSKVYKVALFSVKDIENGVLHGWAADKQMAGTKVAVFFLSEYLGCKLFEEPKELTRRIYESTQEWINKKVDDPIKKIRYSVAINAEMQSQKRTISPGRFAREHLEVPDRDKYVGYLRDKGISDTTIDKATELVDNRLDLTQIAFVNAGTLIAPTHLLDSDYISIQRRAGGHSRVTITDEIKEIRGRGKSGRAGSPTDGTDL